MSNWMKNTRTWLGLGNEPYYEDEYGEPGDEYDEYDDSWLDSWLAADAHAAAAVSKRLDDATGLTGPDVARTLWDALDSSDVFRPLGRQPVNHRPKPGPAAAIGPIQIAVMEQLAQAVPGLSHAGKLQVFDLVVSQEPVVLVDVL